MQRLMALVCSVDDLSCTLLWTRQSCLAQLKQPINGSRDIAQTLAFSGRGFVESVAGDDCIFGGVPLSY